MSLTEKMAYLRGLLEGMELSADTKEGKAIWQMAEVLRDMAASVDALTARVDDLSKYCEVLDEDLGEVEQDVYKKRDTREDDDDDSWIGRVLRTDEETDEDEDDDDYDYEKIQYVACCPSCGASVSLSETQLEQGSTVCPSCGEVLEFDYDTIEAEVPAKEEADGENETPEDTEPKE